MILVSSSLDCAVLVTVAVCCLVLFHTMGFRLRICLVLKRVKVGAHLLLLLGAHDLMLQGFALPYVVDSEETLLHFSVATGQQVIRWVALHRIPYCTASRTVLLPWIASKDTCRITPLDSFQGYLQDNSLG